MVYFSVYDKSSLCSGVRYLICLSVLLNYSTQIFRAPIKSVAFKIFESGAGCFTRVLHHANFSTSPLSIALATADR